MLTGESEDGLVLADSGATHAVRSLKGGKPPTGSEPVQLKLAVGTCDAWISQEEVVVEGECANLMPLGRYVAEADLIFHWARHRAYLELQDKTCLELVVKNKVPYIRRSDLQKL